MLAPPWGILILFPTLRLIQKTIQLRNIFSQPYPLPPVCINNSNNHNIHSMLFYEIALQNIDDRQSPKFSSR